jgi:hypothetical protein
VDRKYHERESRSRDRHRSPLRGRSASPRRVDVSAYRRSSPPSTRSRSPLSREISYPSSYLPPSYVEPRYVSSHGPVSSPPRRSYESDAVYDAYPSSHGRY